MKRWLLGGALGAATMYFLDPDLGRRRRALARDQAGRALRIAGEAGRVTALDAAHRAQGLVAGTRRLLQGELPSDETLVGRVRAALGRVVSHPHAIETAVENGHVTLGGPVLAEEVRGLLRAVRNVPGVRGVSDKLSVHLDSQGVSSLQGGVPRHGERFELLQDHWSPAARLLVGALGAGLMLRSASERGWRGMALGSAGGGLLARAVANRSLAALAGLGGRSIEVQKVITVHAPVEEVFAFWTDYQNFPRFMSKVREVQPAADGRSHWVVAGPAGVPVRWTAEVTRVISGALIEWRATADSEIRHRGSVRFDPSSRGARPGTRVSVRLRYQPPAGAFGHAVAVLFGADPRSEMDADLMRMKTMIETGRPAHDAARPVPRES